MVSIKPKKYDLVESGRFIEFTVDEDSELQGYLNRNGRKFKRGCAFFEFVNRVENIPSDSEVVMCNEVSKIMAVNQNRCNE